MCDSSGDRMHHLPLCPCLRIFSLHSDFRFIISVPLSHDIPYLYNAYKPIPLNTTLQQKKKIIRKNSESRNKWAYYSFFEGLAEKLHEEWPISPFCLKMRLIKQEPKDVPTPLENRNTSKPVSTEVSVATWEFSN